jgi:hypothetical protein
MSFTTIFSRNGSPAFFFRRDGQRNVGHMQEVMALQEYFFEQPHFNARRNIMSDDKTSAVEVFVHKKIVFLFNVRLQFGESINVERSRTSLIGNVKATVVVAP